MSNEQQHILMIAPCEGHAQAVMRILDEQRIADWMLIPTGQCRRMGKLDFIPSMTDSSCDVIISIADPKAIERALAALCAAEQQNEICANCLAYIWPVTRVSLGHHALDPICNMSVERNKALFVDYHGTQFYFCSAECRDRFLDSPEAYSAKA